MVPSSGSRNGTHLVLSGEKMDDRDDRRIGRCAHNSGGGYKIKVNFKLNLRFESF